MSQSEVEQQVFGKWMPHKRVLWPLPACESVADGSGGVWVVGDEAVRKDRNRLASESVA